MVSFKCAPTPAVPDGNPASFAEAGAHDFADQTTLDAAISALQAGDLQAQMESILKPIMELVNSGSPDQVMELLAEKYPDLDTATLEDMLSRAIFVAEVWGRLNVAD